jgi:hypothetical protein
MSVLVPLLDPTKGRITIGDDFDAPLPDMQEYVR